MLLFREALLNQSAKGPERSLGRQRTGPEQAAPAATRAADEAAATRIVGFKHGLDSCIVREE